MSRDLQDKPTTAKGSSRGRSGLANDLQALMSDHRSGRDLCAALACVGECYEGDYLALHARVGMEFYTEEWGREGYSATPKLRETVNEMIGEALSANRSRAVSVRLGSGVINTILVTIIYDEQEEQAGALAMVLGWEGREETKDVLWHMDAISSIFSIFLVQAFDPDDCDNTEVEELSGKLSRRGESAINPVRLAFTMAANLKNRFGLEQVAVGFVKRGRVMVTSVAGLDEVRQANPGVKLIAGAMSECLDRGEPLLCHGLSRVDGVPVEDDMRLHQQWSTGVGGDPVGSFPIIVNGDVVAVVSVQQNAAIGLSREDLLNYRLVMALYANLAPLALRVSRGLCQHGWQRFRQVLAFFGKTPLRRMAVITVMVFGLGCWLALGSLPFRPLVNAAVVAAEPRVVSSPRDGRLLAVKVRPGEVVQAGQVLAFLDTSEEELRQKCLLAELAVLSAKADQSLAEGKAAEVGIYTAQRKAVQAELDLVKQRISSSRLCAPVGGLILAGDLQERLGSCFHQGEEVMVVGRADQVRVDLLLPAAVMQECRIETRGEFVANANPDIRVPLSHLSLPPTSEVRGGENVFVGTAITKKARSGLRPGMRGVARLDLGRRSPWQVLFGRSAKWFRLKFWM